MNARITTVCLLALTDGKAVVLLNRGNEPAEMRVTAADLGLPGKPLAVRDLWTGQRQTNAAGVISARVESHGVAMFRVASSTQSEP